MLGIVAFVALGLLIAFAVGAVQLNGRRTR